MNPVHSPSGESLDSTDTTTDDSLAALLDEQVTPESLRNATSDEILFSICVVLLMDEAAAPDRLRRRTTARSLFAPHSRSRHLGALFQAALRD